MSPTNSAPGSASLEASASGRPKRSTLQQQQRTWGWIFLSPWIFGFFAFTALPIVASLIFTFTDFSLTSDQPINGVGLRNWQKLFSDPLTIHSLGVTLKFALIAVPIGILIPLGMAALLNSKYLWGKRLWRPLFYLPYMVPAISSVFIWQSFLNGQTGWLNRMLRNFGFANPPNWLQDETAIPIALVLIGTWGVGNAMLTMLATMQGVPTELYEAADVDGAGPLTKFRRITIPMISPVIFYNLVLSVIGLMQYFVIPYVITRGTGNPNQSAYFFNMHLYKTAFTFADMGYGSTLAWFIFIIALALTAALFATSRRWVYYASGD
ncbi:MAG: sugar ABC transporter permease [Chloroflexi bacterium]|jgi:multiple sugar transport system permease protein|nr:MAG: ABC transporter permease [Chloroflexi bacterium OLB13]MBC6956528.1 sugar ABC transporter permease [Chloroflexota bacterium]MBV6437505.1 L-arabinose transport system permease protein AraP [Anaerolineae bacterium]MDL1916123.1 sugar ABC transporter permease [Anaerolineae bacterium CFX4]OQY84077.1 MAG: ABC transporter [Anaerolineae bacterium UTCFX5]